MLGTDSVTRVEREHFVNNCMQAFGHEQLDLGVEQLNANNCVLATIVTVGDVSKDDS